MKKKNEQVHFKLLLDKFKAKRKHQAKLSGVDIEDSEMDEMTSRKVAIMLVKSTNKVKLDH